MSSVTLVSAVLYRLARPGRRRHTLTARLAGAAVSARFGLFRVVAFTNPFTDGSADVGYWTALDLLVAAAPWPEALGPGSRNDRAVAWP